jgi:YidC/Oxa1 family membrane protein insertase
MQAQRNTALIFLLILTMVMFYTWSNDKTKEEIAKNQPVTSVKVSADTLTNSTNNINIETDLYSIILDLQGGDIIKTSLKDQKQSYDSDEYFTLLQNQNNFTYIAQSYAVINNVVEKPLYTTSQKEFSMKNDSLIVELNAYTKSGIQISKILYFTKGSHVIDVQFKFNNIPENTNIYTISTLTQSVEDPNLNSSMFGTAAYRGIAYSTQDKKYEKKSLSDVASSSESEQITSKEGGWVSMIQHYFVAAWIGDKTKNNTIIFSPSENKLTAQASIKSQDYITTATQLAIDNKLWLGPKNQDEMNQVSDNLDLTVDYGWLWFISKFLFKAMQCIHYVLQSVGISDALGAWGFSIIILTLCVRGFMYPLTKKQYVSMAKMRLLTPKMQAIKEKFKDDRQKLSQEMMQLYQKEKVNPLGGCLPILVQMPIFIALYWTFMESTELRHSPFILWIHDLSIQDPYYVLPILMGVTMFLIQKMSPTPVTDPMQKKIMTLMPVVFTAMFCTFPAGLTLYWLVSNIVTIIQQSLIFKALEKKGLSMKAVPNKK